jgi:hypothetical protein
MASEKGGENDVLYILRRKTGRYGGEMSVVRTGGLSSEDSPHNTEKLSGAFISGKRG